MAKNIDYGITKTVSLSFNETIEKVREELKKEGFGILSEIDVKATLKKKLDVDIKPYTILGACNPHFAHKALKAEQHIGLMLPCNVVVFLNDADETVVAAIDPIVAMKSIDNTELKKIASMIRDKLTSAIDRV